MLCHEICSLSLNPYLQPIHQSSKSLWTRCLPNWAPPFFFISAFAHVLIILCILIIQPPTLYLQPLPSSYSEQCLWNNPSKIDLTVPFLLKKLESCPPHRIILTSHWKPFTICPLHIISTASSTKAFPFPELSSFSTQVVSLPLGGPSSSQCLLCEVLYLQNFVHLSPNSRNISDLLSAKIILLSGYSN